MDLNTIWFVLISVLFVGYAILDGFDLGVGVLHLFARSDHERRVHLNAIGPVWDGNEVWLLTGGGRTVCRIPRCLCHGIQRFLHRTDAAAGRSDLPCGLHRIPQQSGIDTMEDALGLDVRHRQHDRGRAYSASHSATFCAVSLSTRTQCGPDPFSDC